MCYHQLTFWNFAIDHHVNLRDSRDSWAQVTVYSVLYCNAPHLKDQEASGRRMLDSLYIVLRTFDDVAEPFFLSVIYLGLGAC